MKMIISSSDEKDVGTFIDLANTLEDAATSDRLSGLHRIILAIRPLVFEVKSNGEFADFQKAFDKTYKFVEGDTQITHRLVSLLSYHGHRFNARYIV